MVRQHVERLGNQISFPHARGDGPHLDQLGAAASEFSPRAWGWSVGLVGSTNLGVVFPTRVGMVRR